MERDFLLILEQLGQTLQGRGAILVTAESCTGGAVSQAITAIPGCSAWFDCGFVTYSNASKQALLGVEVETLAEHGAVSEQTAREMALGALRHSPGQISLSVTGVAGPSGGTTDKPVGTVWFAWANEHGACKTGCQHFTGDRETIREQSVEYSLRQLHTWLLDAHL